MIGCVCVVSQCLGWSVVVVLSCVVFVCCLSYALFSCLCLPVCVLFVCVFVYVFMYCCTVARLVCCVVLVVLHCVCVCASVRLHDIV